MKHPAKIKIFMAVCIAASVFAGYIFGICARHYACENIYCVYAEKPAAADYFSAEDIRRLQAKYPAMQITYEVAITADIKANHHICGSMVIGTNEEYPSLYPMTFIRGSFWRGEMNRKSVVVNETLAWKLFGGSDVTGEYLELSGEKYRVCGVARKGGEQPAAWIEGEDKQGSRSLTPSIYIRNTAGEDFQAKQEIQRALAWIGKNGGYRIAGMGRYTDGIVQRPVFLLALCFAWIACKIFRNMIAKAMQYIRKARLEMETRYPLQYIKEKRLSLAKEMLFIAIHFILFIWLVKSIRWEGVFDVGIWQGMTVNPAAVFYFAELRTLNVLAYVSFFTGILASAGWIVNAFLPKLKAHEERLPYESFSL